MFENLAKYYDQIQGVCPIAHTYITAHIGILIDKSGKFLIVKDVSDTRELVPVPCTIESESRTSNVAPHVISDNLSYVGNLPKYKERFNEYIIQLQEYVKSDIGKDDEYANAVYKYVKNGSVYDDVRDIIDSRKWAFTKDKINIVFGVYGLENEGSDNLWTDYYVGKLDVNGICCVTGKPDHIPQTFPGNILSPNSHARLFISGAQVGYIASQKIIHALQWMIYANKNKYRVEVEGFKNEAGLDPKHIVYVRNKHNREIDYDIASYIMDPELREQIHAKHSPCTVQKFYNEYAKEYLKKYKKEWYPETLI